MNSKQILRPSSDVLIPTPKTRYVDIHGLLEASLALACPDDTNIPTSNLLYNSPHGMGKTLMAATLAVAIGEKLGKKIPMVVYDCSEDTRKHDLHGTSKINADGTTAFELGPFPLVIELANEVGFAILCAEEISALTPGAQKQFNALTDWRDAIYISGVGNFKLDPGARIAVIGTMNPCFHPDTDVLTPDGIKSITDLHVGDDVWSFNQETGEYELDYVEQIWCTPCTNGLVHVEGNTADLKITPNHKIFWKRQGVEQAWNKDEVQNVMHKRLDLPKPFDLPRRDTDGHTKKIQIKPEWQSHKTQRDWYPIDAFCRLLGWYLADGSLYFHEPKKDYKITITKYEDTLPVRWEIEKFLEQNEIPFSQTGRDITISDKGLWHALKHYGGQFARGKFIHPDILKHAPVSALEALFDAAYSCDGDGEKAHGMRYSTASEMLRDGMTFLANILGYATSWGFDSGIHRIYLANQRRGSCPKSMTEVSYNGMVINVSIKKNRSLIAGRNGRFTAVGNSAYGGVYTLNDDLRSRFDEFIVPIPTMDQEKKVLRKVCPFARGSDIENVVDVAKCSRTEATDYMLSTRDLVKFLQNRAKLPEGEVPLTLLANKFEGSDRDTMRDRINGKFGSSIK